LPDVSWLWRRHAGNNETNEMGVTHAIGQWERVSNPTAREPVILQPDGICVVWSHNFCARKKEERKKGIQESLVGMWDSALQRSHTS
jgi:hypothetical protein